MSERIQNPGCLSRLSGGLIVVATFVEKFLSKRDVLLNSLSSLPFRKEYYEGKLWGKEKRQILKEKIWAYSRQLSERYDSRSEPLPEMIRERYMSFCDLIENEIQQIMRQKNVGWKRFNDALIILRDAEMRAMQDESTRHIWPLILQIKGEVYEKIADKVTSDDAKKHWISQTIQAYIEAHNYDNFSTPSIIQNPIRVPILLMRMGEQELAKMMSKQEDLF